MRSNFVAARLDEIAERLIARDLFPELLEAGEQEAGVARFVEIGFLPPAAEIADPGQVHA